MRREITTSLLSMSPMIKVDNLGKQYKIGERRAAYGTLRDSVREALRFPINRLKNNGHRKAHLFWALKDISFEVMPGEVIGVIGRNGAGKSTLLKILSRVTEPTTGQADLYGRVGSLLEVGTGFHPELSGRDNVYLNGAILGMKRGEIESKFDEIIAFAEIEKFLDTPVKHYSSGMYMRLAFAVAAHLDPEIFIVDEVLAVGDAAFQKKCLGKMQDVSRKEGRTVLFVSHNMTAIGNLCQKSLWLKNGTVADFGETRKVISSYLHEGANSNWYKQWPIDSAPGNDKVKLLIVKLSQENTCDQDTIYEGDAINLEFEFLLEQDKTADYDITFHLVDEMDNLIFVGSTVYYENRFIQKGRGKYVAGVRIPEGLLIEGSYKVSRLLFVRDIGTIIYEYPDAVAFEVISRSNGRLGWQGKKEGIIRPKLAWDLKYTAE